MTTVTIPLFVLEVGCSKYVGGEYVNGNYGTTTNANLAVSFRSVEEALEWQYDNPLHNAAFIVPFISKLAL